MRIIIIIIIIIKVSYIKCRNVQESKAAHTNTYKERRQRGECREREQFSLTETDQI